MSLRSILFTFLFILPVTMFAGISGTYKISGFDPKTNQKYTGTVVITRSGALYTGNWIFSDNSTDTATGVREDDFISFVFTEIGSNPVIYGTQLYEIDGDTLKGPWVRANATRRGFEKIKKVHTNNSLTLPNRP